MAAALPLPNPTEDLILRRRDIAQGTPMPLDRLADPLPTSLWTARLEAGPEGFQAAGPRGAIPVRPAASCLVAPQAGDIALLHGGAPHAHVIALLERAAGADTIVSAPGGGRLALRAEEITFDAGLRLSASAPEAEFALGRVTLRSTAAALVTGTATLAARLLRSTARSIEQQADRLVAVVGQRTTRVRDADILHAGNTMTQVEALALSRSGSAVMTARQDIRMDAERISLG